MKISIFQESVEKDMNISKSGDFYQDLSYIQSILSDTKPSYILCKESSSFPAKTVIIHYVPEEAEIRDKMIYASTYHTLIQSLGSNKISKSIFISNKKELDISLFRENLEGIKREDSLSIEEKNLQSVKNSQEYAIGCSSRQKYINDTFFLNVSEEAKTAIEKLSKNTEEFNFIQLINDPQTEILNLEMTMTVKPNDIQHILPSTSPRYSIYSWSHTYNDTPAISRIFIYTCPKASTIKERMLYSSSCLMALSTIKQWIPIDKKIEAHDLSDIDEMMLYSVIYPLIKKKQECFLRPKRPGK
ncbi:hypothetical protein T552_01173 [Pneumocystis carinii B80]|uniref:ADF-H domain-containing protein n=1 Tax=Pneumocystis carinii (strain B80) TaxID=1408658 RepID=A0A0W4ZLG5_PNEC8|nr:hypothetical protein T552_01173 [Pneumocystis carinii B80]KTW29217.1 hypothetical protein T552_01173 [Pneumocystis carinii B80]